MSTGTALTRVHIPHVLFIAAGQRSNLCHDMCVGLDACQNANLYCKGEALPLEMNTHIHLN